MVELNIIKIGGLPNAAKLLELVITYSEVIKNNFACILIEEFKITKETRKKIFRTFKLKYEIFQL